MISPIPNRKFVPESNMNPEHPFLFMHPILETSARSATLRTSLTCDSIHLPENNTRLSQVDDMEEVSSDSSRKMQDKEGGGWSQKEKRRRQKSQFCGTNLLMVKATASRHMPNAPEEKEKCQV